METKQYKYTDSDGEHLHTLDGVPLHGTSTVVKVLNKNGLTYWASGLAVREFSGIEDCKILTKIRNNKASGEEKAEIEKSVSEWLEQHKAPTVGEWVKIAQKAYMAHASSLKESAKGGVDMHAELEKYVKLMISDQDGKPMLMNGYEHDAVKLFAEWAVRYVKRFLWSEIHAYSETMWTGGISDCGYESVVGNYGIIDFKSSKESYLSQFIQIAGYDLQISENGGYDADGNKTFTPEKEITEYAVFPFGAEKPEPQFYYDMKIARECFKSCLQLTKAGV